MNVNTDAVRNAYQSLAKNALVDEESEDNKVLVDTDDLNTLLFAFSILFQGKHPGVSPHS